MYYDCTDTATYNPGGVWDANYRGVWHLSGPPNDSTSWDHDGTSSNTVDVNDSAETVVAGAKELSGAPESFISVDDVPELSLIGDLTLSAWINYASLTSGTYRNAIFTRAASSGNPPASGNYPYWLNLESDGTIRVYWEFSNNGYVDVLSTTTATSNSGNWYHLVMVRDSTQKQVMFYFDGALLGDPVDYTDNPTDGQTGVLYFGRSARSDGYEFQGRFDEMRVEAILRSGAWVAAQRSTALDSFITYGSPEQQP
jgi:hypothetical protein